ncbi:hypothetical protein WJU16_20425 [Chitinophaga pollutisoli]|uniref:DUF3592 domain-containing protein n=1 Tax=Chitinophaga pollutisoli TaxID=3133966 RepID=A0ABZ2YKR8_9BACT
MKRNTRLAISLLLIAGGSLIWYLCGYRQRLLYDVLALLFLAGGWLMLGFLCFGSLWQQGDAKYQPDRRNWLRGKKILLLGGLAVLIGGNALLADRASDRLAGSWLKGPLHTTSATVIEVHLQEGRQQYFYETWIRYQAGARWMKERFTSSRHYNPGDIIRIAYAPEHPDVFKVEGNR